tara:strand:- start:17365 stop:18513 length:1149 start_codon:yes stop_codon:yes gene_type:complete
METKERLMKNLNKLLSLVICFVFTKVAFAEMSLSGYQEFFAGSADQSTLTGTTNHGIDNAGFHNGTYSRITAGYSSSLDSGIEISGTMNIVNRDCQGDKTDNCNVTNNNFVTFSGGFGSVSVGERFDAGAAMLSRLTASGPTAEPDGGNYKTFITLDGSNKYGNANETHYAENSMKIFYASNVFNGFSFATSYAPNVTNTGLANTANGQPTATGDFAEWSSMNDVTQFFGKYAMEMDGIGLEIVYGMTSGNAGQIAGNNYNDLDETAYSAKLTYGSFAADYRKNDSGNSGYVKGGQAGNNEGTSICGEYSFGNARAMACQMETSFTDANNRENTSDTMTYAADYALGGGVTVGLLYFDVEETANDQIQTDADGIMTMLSIGF